MSAACAGCERLREALEERMATEERCAFLLKQVEEKTQTIADLKVALRVAQR